ncbi:twin-arginine translocase subunit TatC, partial [Phocaeicola dorei]
MEQQQKILTFWDHLEELRHVLFRIAVAVVFLMLVAFLFKDELFAIVLAPKNADFIIYHFFCRIADSMAMPSLCPEVFYVKMINTQLAAQFITHMSVSFYAGFLLASPYVIYQLFRFVSPALYENEKKYSTRVVGWGYFLFMMGVLLNYFLIFPLTFRFLATYQVSMEVENTITLSSYMDTLMM